MMLQLIPLLTAFGLGSIVTTLVQAWLSQRSKKDELRFQEKKAAYVGLLEAYHRAAVEGTDEAAKHFAYWQMRCDLVASKEVRDAIRLIIDTNDDRSGRVRAHATLQEAMRADLGIVR
ncbi:hypothetical protein KTR66_04015 [Roseococcus sp. SDR]|uniref:hypothetical protein n=1 Tax=Roseococcus sp. SDR TaxID=2835532 RepID=UPI001BCC3180|nr:hypothetical protein [Roseococcus sp. SDR]MBS7789145.1 hypothetical protein [Roseococcus sp. SDR]MBV1844459.1 hypothetical protein [Roseococcus sp. SDR]